MARVRVLEERRSDRARWVRKSHDRRRRDPIGDRTAAGKHRNRIAERRAEGGLGNRWPALNRGDVGGFVGAGELQRTAGAVLAGSELLPSPRRADSDADDQNQRDEQIHDPLASASHQRRLDLTLVETLLQREGAERLGSSSAGNQVAPPCLDVGRHTLEVGLEDHSDTLVEEDHQAIHTGELDRVGVIVLEFASGRQRLEELTCRHGGLFWRVGGSVNGSWESDGIGASPEEPGGDDEAVRPDLLRGRWRQLLRQGTDLVVRWRDVRVRRWCFRRIDSQRLGAPAGTLVARS